MSTNKATEILARDWKEYQIDFAWIDQDDFNLVWNECMRIRGKRSDRRGFQWYQQGGNLYIKTYWREAQQLIESLTSFHPDFAAPWLDRE